MKFYQLSTCLTFLAILGVLALISQHSQSKTNQTPKLKDQTLRVYKASMNYNLGEDKVNIIGEQAELDREQANLFHFHHGVQIIFEKTTLKPEALSIDAKNEVMTIENLILDGASDVRFQHAKIAPEHKLTTAENLTLIAPYPLSSFDTITQLETQSIKTKLKSLQQLQERNRKAKQSNSRSTAFTEDEPQTTLVDDVTQPTPTRKSFTLHSQSIESPLGRFNIRLKMTGVKFSVDQQVISSNFAKYQSGQNTLTFYGEVALHSERKTLKGDYATLDLSTGLLELDDLSTSFPSEAL